MVLYNPEAVISFPRYGIGIPSLDSRKSDTMAALLADPELGPRRERWLRREILPVRREDLERAHDPAYVSALYGEGLREALIRAYELIDEDGRYNRYDPAAAQAPLAGLLDDVLRIVGGSFQAVQHALEEGFCYYLGGGMHHAHPGFGHGFCLLNDICIALLKARREGLLQRAWVVDVDAHRGDGTAEILADREELVSLSVHMARGWPLDSPERDGQGRLNPSWFPGDVDIPIEAGEEGEYLPRLLAALNRQDARKERPDLVLVVGGVDPYEKDELPSTASLKMSKEQMFQRDRELYSWLAERNIPQVWLAAGGYGRSSWEIHAQFLTWALKKRCVSDALGD